MLAGVANLQLKVEYRAIEELSRCPRNPRTHSKKQIAKMAASIKQFGFVVPVLVDEQDQVLAGHGRLEAAALIGMTQVPTICLAHLTKEEKRAYAIADNRLAELAGWDNEILAIELKDLLKIDSLEIEATGFEMGEIDLVIGDAQTAAENPEDLTPASEKPVTRLGDLWRLDDHRLLCGDARDEQSFKALMAGELASMIFADPPYNVEIANISGLGKIKHREFAMASGEMSKPEFIVFLTTVLGNLARSSIDGSIHYICMDWRHMGEVLTAGEEVYEKLMNVCVWAKDNGGMGTFYRSQHELVFVYKHGHAAHLNNFGLGAGGRYRTNLWSYAGVNTLKRGRAEELAMHPTVKPVAMVADAIKDCSKRKGIVLDAFGGSGTTLIAAEKTGRRGYLLELDPLYVDVAIRRWQKLTGKHARLGEGGSTFEEVAAQRAVAAEVDHV
jgi:DNA modification methylase